MIVLFLLLWIAGAGPVSATEIQLTPAQRAALAAVKTIRVRVEQSYRVKDGPTIPEVSLPVEQTTLTMLRSAGRQIVGPETTTADGGLTIRMEGVTVKLLDTSKLDHYMSAELAGEIRLVAAGVSLSAPFSGSTDRFFGSTGRYVRADEFRHPRDAPFLQALWNSKYVAVLAEVVETVSGVDRSDLLVALIGDATFSPTAVALLRESPGRRVADALSTAIRADLGATSELTAIGKRLETMVESLGALDDARAAPTLIAVLQSKSPAVFKTARTSAVRALGRLKEPKAAVPIVAVLTENSRMRGWSTLDGARLDAAALAALREIGDRRLVGSLIAVLKDHLAKPPVQGAVEGHRKRYHDRTDNLVNVLRSLSGQTFGADVKEWTAWWERNGG